VTKNLKIMLIDFSLKAVFFTQIRVILYFDNKMVEEEEMEKQVNDGTFDECAYVKMIMIYVLKHF
jgi:hypothetical protein